MPLYEYQCTRCGHRIEKIQSFKDDPLRVCAQCGGPLERVISAPAIQFKGSGWYVTDYARKAGAPSGNGKAGKESAKEGSESKPGGETTSESKSPKSESKTAKPEPKKE